MNEIARQLESETYDRPHQPWVCGRLRLGEPCELGPTTQGECVTIAECQPIMRGGKWICNRCPRRGGSCDDGPRSDGQCSCPVSPCSPQRSLRNHRARFVLACLITIAATLALTMSSNWRNEAVAPGPLSDSHAQLIRDNTMKRCASCHQAGDLGLANWTLMMLGGGDASLPTQSRLCMECHKSHLTAEFALTAHSYDPRQLAKITRRATISDTHNSADTDVLPFACARCHQEHRGADHDLTTMTSAQCNTCHVQKFQSLAEGHPEFGQWPNGRRTRIVFDHRSHESKHFVESHQEFNCADCHGLDDANEPIRGPSYAACSKCHDDDIQRSLSKPLELVRLPTIDLDVFRQQNISVGEWPPDLVGDFDGPIPPLLYLMLWSDPSAQVALRHFGPQFEFFDVDGKNYDDVEAAADLVWAIKLFLYELSMDGPAAIVRRAHLLAPDQLSDVRRLVSGLDSRQVQPLVNANFRNLRQELIGRNYTLSKRATDLPDVASAGGQPQWDYDVQACVVGVHVEGHAGQLLTSWLELATRLGPAGLPSMTQLLGPTGLGGCFSCHSLDADEGYATLTANWTSGSAPSSLCRPFTKFAHAPHFLQPSLADCRSCHQLDKAADYLNSYASLNAMCDQANFQPMTKAACATCHAPHGAGDSCTKCHHYHVR